MAMLFLYILFFRIGLFSFGGGYAMLPLIYQGLQQIGMMGSEEFSRLVALSQVTPGPIAVNAATYAGYQYAGVPGAIVATLGVVTPSVILVLLVYHFMLKFKESRGLEGILSGIRPATIGLLCSAAVFLAEESIIENLSVNPLSLLFCIIVIFISIRFKIGPIPLTIAAGMAGAFLFPLTGN